MVMLFLKKIAAIMLLVLVILTCDYALVYGINLKMKEALNNATDAAIVTNMDNIALIYANMNEMLEPMVKNKFVEVFEEELGVVYNGNVFKNNGFFSRGITGMETFKTDWHDGFPLVYASLSVQIDTMLLSRLIPNLTRIEINNFDSLYWQWA